jgi:hypothetical protein
MIVKRRLPIRGQSATEDMLLAMVTALTAEIAVLRERLDTTERLLEAAGVLAREKIEFFEPDAAQTAERGDLRHKLISRVFRPLRDAARGPA